LSKKALITGITGQDGSYLAELLLEKGYQVFGIQRRTSGISTFRIDHILEPGRIQTFYGDLDDTNSILRLLVKIEPDEIYNMGSMSHVRISFEIPEYTAKVTGLAPMRILETLYALGAKSTKFYQASSSEMFGTSPPPQDETTPMMPVSPYGCAKLYGYHITRAYRLGYSMFASNGILFNHESERRGQNFVTRKIIQAAARIKLGIQSDIRLGNLEAKRDWGFAGDYVKAIWMILQHGVPDDFIVGTREQHSVKEFAETVFAKLGLNFYDYLINDDQYRRPNEVPSLLANPGKIEATLGWKPEVNFEQLIDMMLEHDLKLEGTKNNVGSQRWY